MPAENGNHNSALVSAGNGNHGRATVLVPEGRTSAAAARNGGPSAATDELETLIRRQLELLGESPDRAGLRRTPARAAAALAWLTRGYRQDVSAVVGGALFEEAHDNMVLVRDIQFYSLCEHHLLPFFGRVHVAYIPRGRVVGLSKIPRIIEVFARRLQVQERLTEQVADALEQLLDPGGVGVVIEAQHLCMMMRGVEKQESATRTMALRGSLRKGQGRAEFLQLVTPAR
jgi:GTP cyclohydrolase I